MTLVQTLALNNGDHEIHICDILRMLWEWPKYFIQGQQHILNKHYLAITFWNLDCWNNCGWGEVPAGRLISQSKFVLRSPFRKAFFFIVYCRRTVWWGRWRFPCVCPPLRASLRKNYCKFTRCSAELEGHKKTLWEQAQDYSHIFAFLCPFLGLADLRTWV